MIELPTIDNGLLIGQIEVDSGRVNLAVGNAIKFTCDSRVECCSNLKIPLTDRDIDKILENGYELDQIVEDYSPMILPIKGTQGKTEKVYAIKRKPFDNTCTFLENNLCKIHKFKPFACKIYPFSIEIISDNEVAIKIHGESLCKSISRATIPDSNNADILNGIKDLIINEMEVRGLHNK